MEIFKFIGQHLALCGIAISKESTKIYPFNAKNVTVFTLVFVFAILFVIMLNEANTFDECTDILFRTVSTATCGLVYLIIVCKTSKLFKFINDIAETVNKSEL